MIGWGVYGVYRHLQQYFSYIMALNFIGGGNLSIRRKPLLSKYLKKCLKMPKRVIRSRKSKKDRQYNGQTKKDRTTNNDLQNTT
jgi:hypothetical protein